jgi:hypothetical protein
MFWSIVHRGSLTTFIVGVFLCLLASVPPATCQGNEQTLIRANQEIGISFAPSLIAYREFVGGTVQDSEHGWISGVGIGASLMHDVPQMKNLLLAVNYDFNQGSSKHRSQPLGGGTTELMYQAPFRSNDVLVGVGKGFMPSSKLLIAPLAEFEYREWHRELPQAFLAIREDYTFWAPGAAMQVDYAPLPILVLKARVGAEYTVSPMVSTIGAPSRNVPNEVFFLGNRPVWQAKLGIDWAIIPSVHALIEGSYSHFGFGNSAVAYFGNGGNEYEPSSVTDLAKVNLGIAWSF